MSNKIIEKTLESRKGTVDKTDVDFTVLIKFNESVLCGAEGSFENPENAYQLFSGTHKVLIDNTTNNSYGIFVSDDRFVFSKLEEVKGLFNTD